MFAGARAGDRLFAMQVGRCGDVNSVEVATEQFFDAASRLRMELLCQLDIGAGVDIGKRSRSDLHRLACDRRTVSGEDDLVRARGVGE